MTSAQAGLVLQYLRRIASRRHAAELPDVQLLARFTTQRDEAAFAALVRRHGPMVLNVCRSVLHHEQDAEDSFQATFLVLARKAGSLRQPEALAGWLFEVAYHVALKAHAAATQRRAQERRATPMAPADPGQDLTLRDLRRVLHEELLRLPEKYRLPLVLCYLEGKAQEEAAGQLGWSKGSFRGRLNRGREYLRRRLETRGVSPSAMLCATAVAPGTAGETLIGATVRAVIDTPGSAAVSAKVTALTEGVIEALFASKLKTLTALLLAVALVTSGTGVLAHHVLTMVQQADGQISQISSHGPDTRQPQPQNTDKGTSSAKTDLFGDPLPEGAIARLGSRRFRHEGETNALRFTSDGKTLVDLNGWPGHRSAVHLWEASTGRELPRLPIDPPGFPHGGQFTGLAVSPDGSTLAIPESAGLEAGTTVALWSLKTGKKTRLLSLPSGQSDGSQCHTICFSPDGKYLAATYMARGRAVVFALPSGKVQAYLGTPQKQVVSNLTSSPDSKMLAVVMMDSPPGGGDGLSSVQLCDIVTGKLIRKLYELPHKGPDSFVRSLAFSRDGKVLALGITNRIVLCDVEMGKTLRELTSKRMGQITGIGFTPDGKTLVTAGEDDGKITVWDVASGKALRTLGHRFGPGPCMALSPDGNTVAFGTGSNAVQMWDVRSGKELFPEEPGHASQVYDLVFSADGKTLISTGLYQKTLLWDVASHQVRGVLPITAVMLQLSSDGKHLACHMDHGEEVSIWDTTERRETVKLKMAKNFRVLSASFAATPGKFNTMEWHYKEDKSGEPVVRQWDLATGKPDAMWPTPTHQDGLNPLVERGKKVYVALSKGGLSIYDIDSKSQRIMPTGEAVQLAGNAFSFDGRVLVTPVRMDAKAPIKIWEVLTGKEIWRLTGHEGCNYAVAWSADGRLLVSGDQLSFNSSGAAQTIRLWDTASGKQLACFGNLGSDLNALAFTPDSAVLAAGLRDSSILVYDVRKYDPRREPSARLNQIALESLWNELASDQAGKAHQALWQLVDGAQDALPFLKSKMKPRDRVDAAAVQKWIADLDSEKYPVRQEAARQLQKCGGQVRAILEAALHGTLSLETRRRLQDTLNSLDLPDLESLRTIRGIMVLERIGSFEARGILETLARGAAGDHTTEEARDSLRRLTQHTSQTRPK